MAESTQPAVPGNLARPAVEFAEWLPALGGSRLLRVHGEAAVSDPPALVLRGTAGERRIEPRGQSRFTRAHEWRASYLIPAELVTAGWSETILEWPAGTRIPLPDPPAPESRDRRPLGPHNPPSPPRSLAGERAAGRQRTHRPPASGRRRRRRPRPPPAPAPSSAGLRPRRRPTRRPSFSAAARIFRPAGAWTDPPGAFSRSVFEAEAVWTAKRAELERELTRAAEAIAASPRRRARGSRRGARGARRGARRPPRRARGRTRGGRRHDRDAEAELEAERIAHAVARRTAADLRDRARAGRAGHPPDDPPHRARGGAQRPRRRRGRAPETRRSAPR